MGQTPLWCCRAVPEQALGPLPTLVAALCQTLHHDKPVGCGSCSKMRVPAVLGQTWLSSASLRCAAYAALLDVLIEALISTCTWP